MCSGGETTCAQCHHRLGNGAAVIPPSPPGQNGQEEGRGGRGDEELGGQSDGVGEDHTHTPTHTKDQTHTPTGIEGVVHVRIDTEQTTLDCSQDLPIQNYTHPTLSHTPSPVPQSRTQHHTHTPSPEHTPTDTQNPLLGTQHKSEVSPQCVCDTTRCVCRERSAPPVSPVPAPPSKPLPKPIPRRPRRPELKRQDGLDAQLTTHTSGNNNSTHSEAQTHTEVCEMRTHSCDAPVSTNTETDEHTHTDNTHIHTHTNQNADTHDGSDVETPTREAVGNHGDTEPSDPDVVDGDDDPASIPPVPPPRQKSLSHKTSSSLDNLLEHADTHTHSNSQEGQGADEGEDEDDEDEGGYGDFARYPITRSLPKQIKFRCVPRVAAGARSASSEERSPKVAPKKPQRHSMPAKHTHVVAHTPEHTPPPTHAPPPVAVTTFPELPAPPQEKPAWRLPLPTILFGRNQVSRASTGSGSSGQSQSNKQRARSFSSADLAARVEGPVSTKRSSFQKLLELRMSVRMLPRLLIKSSHSLDCTSAQTEIYSDAMATQGKACLKGVTNGQGVSPGKSASPGDGPANVQGTAEEQSEVEYENVPLYEEIPEYMNLPLCRLSWNPSTSDDADVYEVQEPYKHKGKHNRSVRVCVSE